MASAKYGATACSCHYLTAIQISRVRLCAKFPAFIGASRSRAVPFLATLSYRACRLSRPRSIFPLRNISIGFLRARRRSDACRFGADGRGAIMQCLERARRSGANSRRRRAASTAEAAARRAARELDAAATCLEREVRMHAIIARVTFSQSMTGAPTFTAPILLCAASLDLRRRAGAGGRESISCAISPMPRDVGASDTRRDDDDRRELRCTAFSFGISIHFFYHAKRDFSS